MLHSTLLALLVTLHPTQANAEESESEDTSGFEWDISLGPVLNSAIVMNGDLAGNAAFSAGMGASGSAGFRLGERTDEGEGSVHLMLGGGARTETPTGLIAGEASSRTYLGHLRLGGAFDAALISNLSAQEDFEVDLLVGGGQKLSYDAEGARLLDPSGNPVNQTVLMFGARAQAGSNRIIHLAPNLMFTFGGPDSMALPATFAFSLSTGVSL